VLRDVTLQVDQTVWRRPGANPAPETITVETWGWFQSDGDRALHLAVDAPRLEVGKRYLMPLVKADGEWTPLSDPSVLTLEGELANSEVAFGYPRDLAASLDGQSVQQIQNVITSTVPHPEAAPFMQMDADERVRRFAARRGSP